MTDNTFGKQQWTELFKATGISEAQMSTWHCLFEKRYPDSHRDFLSWLGLSDEEAIGVRNSAKDI